MCIGVTDVSNPNDVNCCAVGILSAQSDFLVPVKSMLEEGVNAAGHLCIFLYHCELNPIEMVWGRAKQIQRNECLLKTVKQEENIRRWLNCVTVENIRKFTGRCQRFMMFYRLGCSVHLVVTRLASTGGTVWLQLALPSKTWNPSMRRGKKNTLKSPLLQLTINSTTPSIL